MAGIEVGQVAPSFRLPSGQGPEISPEDYRGRNSLIVWFTKGLGCPFCRKHTTQIVQGYQDFKAMNGEVLEITTTPVNRARVYVSSYKIPFPYLCDPDRQVGGKWGLGVRSHSFAWYAKTMYAGATMRRPPTQFDAIPPALGEFPGMLADDDTGFYIVDKKGIVRYSVSGSYRTESGARPLPSNDEIIRELELLQTAA